MNSNNKIILFDGVCNLCNSSVMFIIKRDKKKVFKFSPLQSDFGKEVLSNKGLNQKDLKTVIYLSDEKVYVKSEAAIRIAFEIGGWLRIAGIGLLIPRFIRDFFYEIIAKYRYNLFGKREQCMIPEVGLKNRFIE